MTFFSMVSFPNHNPIVPLSAPAAAAAPIKNMSRGSPPAAAAAPIESMIILSMGAAAARVQGSTLTCIRIKDQESYTHASYL